MTNVEKKFEDWWNHEGRLVVSCTDDEKELKRMLAIAYFAGVTDVISDTFKKSEKGVLWFRYIEKDSK